MKILSGKNRGQKELPPTFQICIFLICESNQLQPIIFQEKEIVRIPIM